MDKGRLIFDGEGIGSWNMAVDQALLQNCESTGETVLRFYRWEPATLSLGYFQSAQQRKSHHTSVKCAMVRRVTGGGAILHHHEITYSLVLPGRQRWSAENERLYTSMHGCIVDVLKMHDVDPTICQESENDDSKRFLCFQRRTKGDLLVGADKVGGSAQRRCRTSLLQHGSLLLHKSEYAPELQGLCDLCKFEINEADFIRQWVEEVSKKLKIDFSLSEYSAGEIENANSIRNAKFDSDSWNLKR